MLGFMVSGSRKHTPSCSLRTMAPPVKWLVKEVLTGSATAELSGSSRNIVLATIRFDRSLEYVTSPRKCLWIFLLNAGGLYIRDPMIVAGENMKIGWRNP